MARCSLEAEFNDFLGEEVIQALVQLSHDAVRLRFLWRRAARGLPLKETNRDQLFDDEFTLKALTKQIPNIHPAGRFGDVRDLRVAERVSSSWVLAGIWCDVPEFCAPWAAARPAGQILRPVESGEGGGLRSTLTFCPAVKEKEEEGPRRG